MSFLFPSEFGLRSFPFLFLAFFSLSVSNEHKGCIPYKRDLYPHWIDADHDGLNTRKEVLQRSNLEHSGPKVGRWFDPYTGRYFVAPESLQIDHVVALSEAHKSGAWAWDEERRTAFANDLGVPENLMAVNGPVNEDKSDKDPAEWLPPDTTYWSRYVRQWLAVKDRWELSVDSLEWDAIQAILGKDTVGIPHPRLEEEYSCKKKKLRRSR